MNRDELLTNLAMEVGEWPHTQDMPMPPIIATWTNHGEWECFAKGSDEPIRRADWLAERELLINKPSWDDAPEWANWLAQDGDGTWAWFESEPEIEFTEWTSDGRFEGESEGNTPAGHDWRTTLEARPIDVTPEEEEAWSAFDESRIDRIAQSDGSGDHYGVSDGRKFDNEKPMMGLIPPLAEEALARVLTFGAKKYAPDNWRKVEDKERRYMDAMLRHLNAHRRGEKADPETGESHLAHAACCVMFMLELEEEVK